MPTKILSTVFAAALLHAIPSAITAQSLAPFSSLSFDNSGPVIRAHAEMLKPFTVAGERGVILGQQDGTFEAWPLPVKLLSHMTIEANIEGYAVPIDVNQQAAEIEVRPDRTTITYSHIGFTIRQIMTSPADTGAVVLYEFDCLHPTDFVFRFTPELRWMWPERNEGVPSAEWIKDPSGRSGFYVLHSDYPDFAGALTIPGAEPGIMSPYEERPQVHPVELKLHIDPARDHGKFFPLLMTVGTSTAAANTAALKASLENLYRDFPKAYDSHVKSYQARIAASTTISTPDQALDEAFQWAVISIEQLKTHVPQRAVPADNSARSDESAMVAGYYASGDSARPGFGWFFGRDALYTLYAVNGYGDFDLARKELDFLTARQRADGKIMHEYSQTAADIDWKSFPYMYAAADATPLYLLAFDDYVQTTGDTAFLAAHRDAIEKAWNFERTHDADGDGIYDNSEGTGWVESWPVHMPHQEIYLALLDQQASVAMARIEKLLGDEAKSAAATQRAEAVAKTIEAEYYQPNLACYAFSRNHDSSLDSAATVYPALAWWSDFAGSRSYLAHPAGCLQAFAAHTLATDWGLRDVSTDEKFYDGMSYHQGSVWPLFTGWAALAEYRGGQPQAGYQLLKENANLTWAQDLGGDTELLSGDFFVPFGRSTSHQLWSSAMVITPALRGLFGISIDAAAKTITVDPNLPAEWDHAEVKNLHVGDAIVDLAFRRIGSEVQVSLGGRDAAKLHLASRVAGTRNLAAGVSIPEQPVQMSLPFVEPMPGSRTQNARVLRTEYGSKRLTLTVEGQGGSEVDLSVLVRAPKLNLRASGAEVASATESGSNLRVAKVRLPSGDGWKTASVTLSW